MSETYSGKWEEYRVEEVREEGDYYDIRLSSGWSFGLNKKYLGLGVVPHAGDTIRQRLVNMTTIAGVELNGVQLYNDSDEKRTAEHEEWVRKKESDDQYAYRTKWQAEQDADYAKLPAVFQKRLDKFRANNPNFGWKYERYELFCCKQAVLMAGHFQTHDALDAWVKLDFKEQFKQFPQMTDDHSGNTFGMSVKLAHLYIEERFDDIVKLHGALAPLIGSRDYGCIPKDASEEEGAE